MELRSTREAFGNKLVELGQDEKIIALTADLKVSVSLAEFANKFPERFIDCGVAEQNMASTALGLSYEGFIPFIASFAVFSPGRNLDQLRLISYSNANVKICSSHAGLSVGEDGATHQALEDIAIMRTLPNMTVLVPADYYEAERAIEEAYKLKGPVYIRLGRPKIHLITKNTHFRIGKAKILREGNDITIIACGLMVEKAIEAANLLHYENISVEVINCSTIKPLDKETILSSVRKTNIVLTVEEHQITGGLGSAISEFLSRHHPVFMDFIGVNDRFGQSGSMQDLMDYYGLTTSNIVAKARRLVHNKNNNNKNNKNNNTNNNNY